MTKINTVVADPKENVRQKPHEPSVGNERKADMSVVGETSLGGAMKELAHQHPIHHDDLGPHHHDESHVRHMPLHGMRPSGRG